VLQYSVCAYALDLYLPESVECYAPRNRGLISAPESSSVGVARWGLTRILRRRRIPILSCAFFALFLLLSITSFSTAAKADEPAVAVPETGLTVVESSNDADDTTGQFVELTPGSFIDEPLAGLIFEADNEDEKCVRTGQQACRTLSACEDACKKHAPGKKGCKCHPIGLPTAQCKCGWWSGSQSDRIEHPDEMFQPAVFPSKQ
jgi:hypothetical protein